MKDLNRGTRTYILATYAAALAMVLHVLHGGTLSFDTEFLTLALIGAIMAPHTVHLGMRVEMSISHPFILATMILLGSANAVLISIICISSLCFIRAPRMAFYRALFNIASFVITTFATCHTYVAFGGSPQGGGSVPLFALMIATLVFYLVNTYSISGVVALSGRLNIFKVWHENFLWSAPSFFAGGSLALGMSYFLQRFGIYSFVLSLPFCVLIYYSYKLYLDKLEEKKQHLEDIERMNADLERKVKERTQQLEVVNEKLQESNLELQRANSLKSEFLANMSHELRTPLNAVIGFSELLLDTGAGTLSEDQKDYVADILSSGRHLLELINEILDLSKIEAGKMKLSIEEFEIGPVCDEAMALLRVEAGRKHIELVLEVEDRTLEVRGDRSKVKQIMNNLLSNAVKFTHPGGRVTLRTRRDGDGLAVSVIDTGIGIREEDQDRIFQAFTQVDGSYARRYQGTGLGLTLVKKFVEMHGGRVSLTSRFGEGCDFTFIIPGVVTPRAQAVEPSPGDLPEGVSRLTQAATRQGDLILVVEDNPINMKLVRDILKANGYRVAESTTGEEALDALKFIRPDLILMDIQLPGMDGLRAARLLRENPETRDIPVVALTAHVMKGDEVRAKEAGCAGYIPKPIEPSEFPRQIAAYLQRGAGPGAN
jgi:signal transduction histidine kinase/ActR/RegA family two-component response regulator